MKLELIQSQFVDYAWRDGASCLKEACDTSGGEITGDQLKLILARGERQLVRIDDDGTVGWGVFRIDQLPNIRVLHITDLVAHNGGFERFFDEIAKVAQAYGCSAVRCAAGPAQERLYRMKCGFEPIYTIMQIDIQEKRI